jgi:isoquinoline 1-oxidoreductase
MDVLAHSAKIDPLEFRLKNLEDARLRAVLEAAAKTFGWPRAKAEGHGFGVAGGNEKGSYVATCAEIAVDKSSGNVRVVRLVTAFECGAIVNPDGLRNQVIGANIQGLGGALFEAVEFENGRITNPRFSRYRVPRFRDVPEIEAVLLDRKDIAPAGAGETPIMAVAPAVGNAIFDATGQRLNNLPLIRDGLKKTGSSKSGAAISGRALRHIRRSVIPSHAEGPQPFLIPGSKMRPFAEPSRYVAPPSLLPSQVLLPAMNLGCAHHPIPPAARH